MWSFHDIAFPFSSFISVHLIVFQTYVGDWGEELLEGRVDVADFFD
jgi:hypothetical protein